MADCNFRSVRVLRGELRCCVDIGAGGGRLGACFVGEVAIV